MKRRTILAYCLLPALAALAALGAGAYAHYVLGASIPLLDPSGPVALHERNIILLAFGLCAIVVIPTFFFLFFFAWRYRADGPAASLAHEPNWDHDNMGAELFWWLVPSAIILVLAVVAWNSSHALDPYKPLAPDAIEIDAVSLDWKWLFIYPAQGAATVNELMLPAGRPVTFKLTSDAPMNSLWIPALAGQIMTMPGMVTQLNLLASTTGDFNGFSGNISGEGFADMAFQAHVLAPDAFAAWAAATASSTPLDDAAYDALAQPSRGLAPAAYMLADPGLFDRIVDKYMMPGMSGAGAVPATPAAPAQSHGTMQGMQGMEGMGSMQGMNMGSMTMP
jgi:cytochrome o ubiquinol oxidase subunit 2